MRLKARAASLWHAPATPWIVLAAITVLAYINAFHDVLISDDREFLANGRFDQLAPGDYIDLFFQSAWEASGSESNLYRPLLLVMFGIESALFGDWAVGYHLFNVLLHVASTLLVFGLVREIFLALGRSPRSSSASAFLGALVFGVHPALTEVVNLAFNGSELYVAIAVAGGLWYLLLHSERHPARAWGLLCAAYLVGLLFRESAVSLPALAVLTLWMTRRGPWFERLKACLPALLLLLPLAIYLALRVNALDPADPPEDMAASVSAPVATQAVRLARYEPPLQFFVSPEEAPLRNAPGSFLHGLGANLDPSRLSLAVSTWFDALKLMVWPHPLVSLREVSLTPLWLALTVQLALLGLALFSWLRGSPAPLLGLLFFYAAILPSSRIISDSALPPLLLDRMLYLPAVGLVILLSSAFFWLGKVRSMRSSALVGALVVLTFLPITWARNAAWGNELELLEHDLFHEPRNGQLLSSLIKAHAREGQAARSMRLCEQFTDAVNETLVLVHDCAMVYAAAGLQSRAEKLFLHALTLDPGSAWDHFELARLYVRMDERDLATSHFRLAIQHENLPFIRELMRALMLIDLYPGDPGRLAEAKNHLERALQMQPRSVHARQLLEQLEQGSGP